MSLDIVPKGASRLTMMSGVIDISEVKRIVVGPAKLAPSEYPRYWIRIVTVETKDGDYDLILEGPTEDSLRMHAEGGLIATLKKQVRG